MAVITNGGLNLIASALQTSGANVAVTYVSVGLGAGTLSAALTSSTAYTSLSLQAPLVYSISPGQSLTLIDALGDTQAVTTTGTNSAGSSTINVVSFVASANFAIGSGVVNTPAATDTQLQNEASPRVAATPGSAGALAGESLNSAFFNPAIPANTYLEVGYWGGSTATSSLGTGTLMARGIQFWAHTLGADSATYQLDTII